MTFSTPSSALADDQAALAALCDVVEQSFFAYVEPCGVDAVRDEIAPETPWIGCSMRFSGHSQEGEVALALPMPLACELAAAFAGCDAADLGDPMVEDLAGELCNMVGGLWLTRASTGDSFRLESPQVAPAGPPDAGRAWTLIRVNGTPMGLWATRQAS